MKVWESINKESNNKFNSKEEIKEWALRTKTIPCDFEIGLFKTENSNIIKKCYKFSSCEECLETYLETEK